MAILPWLQAVLALPSQIPNVTTFDTPSYYPGAPYILPGPQTRANICQVKAAEDNGDSAPAILSAFERCGHDGKIIFNDATYHIESVLTTTNLSNVEIDIRGTLLWDTDIEYWLANSLPMGYQNQSTAWYLGGDNIWLHGNGNGTFDGNGQVWYDFTNGASNYPRRPHQITLGGLTNSVIENLRFVQSQMWTMTLINSENVLLQDIYVNSTNLKGGDKFGPLNTDGADTIYSNNITFARWVVDCGDDSISQKANSTNILMEDLTFYHGSGVALGSIGQFNGKYEFIENITARNIEMFGPIRQGGYIKTWTGVQKGVPPNGGGGGLGYIKNVTFNNFTLHDAEIALDITQCVNFEGGTGDCDTSEFQISDLHWYDIRGTQQRKEATDFQCSAAVPCPRISVTNLDMTVSGTGEPATGHKCSNVLDPVGFECDETTSKTPRT
ncbi:Putative glycoside hydrolase, family 28, pectin lyase/virulence factor [Septoria linicola]|uniref:Glycoside hydrolase, family 28, pectin lyase/virulence factor n=1 Tax=Septoria linicola TaxID=215465 RepID=A0A9Q9AC10_9PEZI|nr:Putative glycoside hydrolase, family 28, pectin lyase/virulence factor [Septoria linicola]